MNILRRLLVPLSYTLIALGYTWPLATSFGTAIVGGGIDGWNNYWNYWWTRYAVFNLGQLPFDSNYIFYNSGVSLRFHTLQPLNGLLSAGLQPLGLAVAENTLTILSYTLCGWGVYLLARYVLELLFGEQPAEAAQRQQLTTMAAYLAGFAYTFASPWRTQYLYGGQVNRLSFQWVPFFIYFALRAYYGGGSWRARSSWLPIALTALLFLANALTELQLLVYLALFLLVWLAAELVARGWQRWWPAALRVAVGVGAGGLLLSPLLYQMLRELAANSQLAPSGAATTQHSADLLELVAPNRSNLLWGGLLDGVSSPPYDKYLVKGAFSPSYLLYGLAVAGVVLLWRSPLLRILLLNLLLFLATSLGPHLIVAGKDSGLPMPYAALYLLPFMRVSRDPERFGEMALLFWVLLAAVGFYALLTRLASGLPPQPLRQRVAFALVLLILTVEFVGVRPPLTAVDTPPFYQQLGKDSAHYAILELPIYKSSDEDRWMSYQAAHEKAILGGDLARKLPHPFAEYTPVLRALWLQRQPNEDVVAPPPLAEAGLPVLAWAGIRYLVVIKDRVDGQTGREQGMADALFGKAQPGYEDERMRVYSVPLTVTAYLSPMLAVGPGWYAPEQQPDGWHRWLDGGNGNRATISMLNLDRAQGYVLHFRAFAYAGPHELEVYQVAGSSRVRLATLSVNQPQVYDLPLALQPGLSQLEFYTAVAARSPGPKDSRLLAVGLGNLTVTRP